jgi:hypothetical protein
MESTTQIYRRKVRHWKTTAAGLATIAGPILIIFLPDYSTQISLAVSTLTGAGLMAAADADKAAPK